MQYVLYDLDCGTVSVFTSKEKLDTFLKNVRQRLVDEGYCDEEENAYQEYTDYQLFEVDAVDPEE